VAHLIGIQREKVDIVECRAAADIGAGSEAKQGLGADRLAASLLTDDAEGLPAFDAE
jgi:hypothetical protein